MSWVAQDERATLVQMLRDENWLMIDIARETGRSKTVLRQIAIEEGLRRRRSDCERCGEPIEQPATGRPRRFCSRYCVAFKGPLVQPAFDCPVCKKHVPSKVSPVSRRFCSRTCNKRASYLAGTSGGWYAKAHVEEDPDRREFFLEQGRAYSRDYGRRRRSSASV